MAQPANMHYRLTLGQPGPQGKTSGKATLDTSPSQEQPDLLSGRLIQSSGWQGSGSSRQQGERYVLAWQEHVSSKTVTFLDC